MLVKLLESPPDLKDTCLLAPLDAQGKEYHCNPISCSIAFIGEAAQANGNRGFFPGQVFEVKVQPVTVKTVVEYPSLNRTPREPAFS